jgi:polygalacturonase
MKKVNFKSKWALAVLALFGVSLISAGVFASASITLNSNGTVNLGAGAVGVSVCDQQATISAQQSLIDGVFKLTTISLQGIEYDECDGKTITMAFVEGGETYQTTWAIDDAGFTDDADLIWGGTAGDGMTGSTALPVIDTADSDISTIAISAS